MVKIKVLSNDLKLKIVTVHNEEKYYKTISIPILIVQSIIKKSKNFCIVKNLKGWEHKPKVSFL